MLKNKVAIVTGASSGIGEATAKLFAQHGASVILADIDKKGGERVEKAIKKAGGSATFFKANSGKPKDNEALVKFAVKTYGKLDVAVNNAGIGGAQAPVGEYPVKSWDEVINVNLSGVFYGMRYQLPAMTKGGAIVNMASILGQVGTQGSSAYVAAKHGVVGLTQASALEYAEQGIRINAVGPGYIKTPLLDNNLSKEQLKGLKSLHPMARLGTSEEVAELVLWLSSDKASFVTGSYYNVDGGYLAQ